MSANRLFKVLIALTVIMVVFFAVREANGSSAFANADRSYDAVEQVRAGHSGVDLLADRSYDAVESLRDQRAVGALVADRSYDQIETMRVMRVLP